jgi:hypothetical protein
MKRFLAACFVLVIAATANYAKDKGNKYMVQVPHTKEECLSALDEFKEKGANYLSKWEFGCGDNDHTGYAMLFGKDANDVKSKLPKSAQAKAKIAKVSKFTVKQIEDFHKGH